MFEHAFQNLDSRKWFDRMQPQTLSIATWLLYFDGVFAVIGFLERSGEVGIMRGLGGLYLLMAFVFMVAYIVGPFLMANGKRLGWYVAVAASFGPFVLRLLINLKFNSAMGADWSLRYILTSNDTIGFMFEAALCALLLHTMSRKYIAVWLR
ncbi:unannotated protein [freshwater metagenome]|uniref:Unannotated protein n=1 Tax=freshwater metagenome TaxID=449393 RepID=A0A6J6HFN3_9ZZZZ|nr:hypothetical protein [Actinomycetota bacterium]MSZ96422.1 hypothetical protein [Actinomycetota bacterium]